MQKKHYEIGVGRGGKKTTHNLLWKFGRKDDVSEEW